MARYQRQTRIMQSRARLPGETGEVGRAIVKTADVARTIIAEKAEAEALEKAALAVQAYAFERDTNGHIVAPPMPENDKTFGMTVYDRAYSEMMLDRYGQQIVLDGRKKLTQFANENPLQPDAFTAAANSYIESVKENVLPHIAGAAGDQLMSMAVGIGNNIARKRTEWDRKNALDTGIETINVLAGEAQSLAAAGAQPSEVMAQQERVMNEWLKLEKNLLVNPGERFLLERQMDRDTALGITIHGLTLTPPTNEDEAMAQIKLNKLKNGEGNLTVVRDGAYVEVPVTDILPTSAERNRFFNPLEQVMGDRVRDRKTMENYLKQNRGIQFLKQYGSVMYDAYKNGTPIDEGPALNAIIESIESNNPYLRDDARGMLNFANFANNQLESRTRNIYTHRASLALMGIDYLEAPEAVQYKLDRLSEAVNGSDFMGLLSDPRFTPEEMDVDAREAAAAMILSRIDQTGGKQPNWILDLQAAFQREAELIAKRQKDWNERNGYSEEQVQGDPDLRMERQRIVMADLPQFDVPQNKTNARFFDQWYAERLGMASEERPYLNWATMNEQQLDQALAIVDDRGVIPQSMIEFANQVLRSPGTNQEYWSRMIDLSEAVFDSQSMTAQAETAFGANQTAAMSYIAAVAGPNMISEDDLNVRDTVGRIMKGENPFTYWTDLPAETREQVKVAIREAAIDENVEVWAFGEPVSVFRAALGPGDAITWPEEMRRRAEHLAAARSTSVDVTTGQGRSALVSGVMNDLKAEGWAMSRYQIDSTPYTVPWYTGLFTEGGLAPIVSGRRASKAPIMSWTQYPIDSFVTDPDNMKEIVKEVNKDIANSRWWQQQTSNLIQPKLGENIMLVYAGIRYNFETEQNEPSWYAVVNDEAGAYRPVVEDMNLNNYKIYQFGDMLDSIEARRARELESRQKELRRRAAAQSSPALEAVYWYQKQGLEPTPEMLERAAQDIGMGPPGGPTFPGYK